MEFLLIRGLVAFLFIGVILRVSPLLGSKQLREYEKNSPFECGFDPVGIGRLNFSVPRKNKTNPLALYSVLNPDTSSDSPSAKSKGVRLVSAKADSNHKTEIGKRRRISQWLNLGNKLTLSQYYTDRFSASCR
ncbi:NADH-ubiquinone oxidoreductase chain 3, partial [Armadillidium nasatum]